MSRTPSVHLRLLGGFELKGDDGRDCAPLGRKVRALLACLALPAGKAWPREKLMALLWSDRGEEQARASLRQALAELRRCLGEPSPLQTSHDTVALDPAMISVDAVAFEQLAKADKVGEAVALYLGPLLDGHGVRDDSFEEWLRFERTRLHHLAVGTLDRHANAERGDKAIQVAQRLLQLDPLREASHRLLMRLYAGAGQRAEALRQYQQCRDLLHHELKASPQAETERLHREILDEPAAPGGADATTGEDARAVDGRPSIAVRRFTNMSEEPDRQYFSDGITEDIITELSRYRSLFVIARPFELDAMRRRLAVRYVVEGSVRRAGERLRVTAQLIDGVTGAHLWAERYDRDIEDVFAVQEEIARTIATTLEGRVAASGIAAAKRKPTTELAAYDCFLRGRERDAYFDLAGAEVFYAQATALDPSYVHAHAQRAMALTVLYWLHQDPEMLRKGEASARAALALDDHDGMSHEAMGYVALHQRRFELAGIHFERAVSLNPNDIYIAADHANWLTRTGRPTEALQRLDEAMRRDPFSPTWLWEMRSNALFHLGRYEESIAALRAMSTLHPWHFAHLAAAYAQAGKLADAQRELATFLQVKPGATVAQVAAAEPYETPALLEPLLNGLRKAGLAE
jgi:TolB-like protein/Flp pilus assembly protein TadD